ncbi:hypothetical protein OC845_001599 [Tilletia horrida]|nr:hypothetical protein OC845_001599 [Tilletia horrida]
MARLRNQGQSRAASAIIKAAAIVVVLLGLAAAVTVGASPSPVESGSGLQTQMHRRQSPSPSVTSASSEPGSLSSTVVLDNSTSSTTVLLTAAPDSSATTTLPLNFTSTVNATTTATPTSTSMLPTSTPLPSPTMPAGILSNFSSSNPKQKIDFLNPLLDGGFMTTILPMPNAPNLPFGEPINAIISGRSSPSVVNVEGFLRWATSVNMGVSCLGQTNGSAQLANLGDGRGNVTQGNDGTGANGVLRWNYGDPYLGTCRESVIGGNHLRWFPQAKTGAYFLAASVELTAAQGHMIALNGYNNGRDEVVGNATNPNGTEWAGYRFNTTVEWIPAGVLLNATSEGINHPDVALPGQPSQDGRVALLTITQIGSPDSSAASPRWGRRPHSSSKDRRTWATLLSPHTVTLILLPALLVAATASSL